MMNGIHQNKTKDFLLIFGDSQFVSFMILSQGFRLSDTEDKKCNVQDLGTARLDRTDP